VCPAGSGLSLWTGDLTRQLIGPVAADTLVLAAGFPPGGAEVRVCCADGSVRTLRTDDGTEVGRWSVPRPLGPPTAARFTADAGRLAVGDGTGLVLVFSASGKPEAVPADAGARTPVQVIAWRPDGRALAAGYKEGRVVTWLPDGTARPSAGLFPIGYDSLEFSPDGAVLAAAQASCGTIVWDSAGGVLLSGGESLVGFSQDGRRVVLASDRSVSRGRWLVPTAVRPLRGHTAPVGKLVCSFDRRRLASLDGRYEARVWDAETGAQVAAFPLPTGGFYPANAGLALGRDGRLVAYASGGRDESLVVIRDVTKGKEFGPWRLPGGFDHLIGLDGDRFRLVREEFLPGSEALETVLYDLGPRRGPVRLGTIRKSRPADRRRYFDGVLTDDGGYYLWCGPREPRGEARIEVYELPAGRLVYTEPVPLPTTESPGLGYESRTELSWTSAGVTRRLGLPVDPAAGAWVEQAPVASTSDRLAVPWMPRRKLQIVEGPVPFGIAGDRTGRMGPLDFLLNLRDGSRFAWSDRTGVILLCDRTELTRKVAELARDRLP